MAGRILVLQPASLAEFTDSLQKVKISLLQRKVKLLIIDSMAAVVSGVASSSRLSPLTLKRGIAPEHMIPIWLLLLGFLGLMQFQFALCLKQDQDKDSLRLQNRLFLQLKVGFVCLQDAINQRNDRHLLPFPPGCNHPSL